MHDASGYYQRVVIGSRRQFNPHRRMAPGTYP